MRNAQLVKASVIWSTVATPTVPVLAISRLGGQAFVYIVQHEQGKAVARQRPVQLGDTVGNDYAVSVRTAQWGSSHRLRHATPC